MCFGSTGPIQTGPVPHNVGPVPNRCFLWDWSQKTTYFGTGPITFNFMGPFQSYFKWYWNVRDDI